MSRSTNKRSLGTLAALLIVPAAAVGILGAGLGTASGTAPSGVLVSESRAVTFADTSVPATTAAVAAKDKKVDDVLTDWQNTVRRRPRSAR
jgi:hypothetical protein